MNSHPDLDLLQSYLNGELAAPEAVALEVRLKSEPALAEALVILAREEAILTEWARAARETSRVCAEDQAGHESKESANRAGPTFGRRRWMAAGWVLLPAAAVLLAVLIAVPGWWSIGEGTRESDHAAVRANLEEIQGEVYLVTESGRSILAALGQSLVAGQGLRTGGEGSFAVVTFPDQTRLELGAETRINFLADDNRRPVPGKRIFLAEGLVAAAATPQGEAPPLFLSTPHVEAEVQGKRFNIASAAEATRVELEEGEPIHLTRKSDGKSFDLPTGWYTVTAPEADDLVLRPLPARIDRPRSAIREGSGPILSVAYAPDGKSVATGNWDGTVKIWDVATEALRRTLGGHKRSVRALAWSTNGQWLASGADERIVKLWDPTRQEELAGLKGHRTGIEAVAFSPDGRLLVSVGGHNKDGAEIRLWDLAALQEQINLKGHTAQVTCVAFSPDGKTLATGGRDTTVILWDLATHTVRRTLRGHSDRITGVAFSPDGKTLATGGGRDCTVRLWDATTGDERMTLRGHTREVRCLAFSPDGRTLATGDPLVRLWDLRTGRERLILHGHKYAVTGLAFSPDGQTLASVGWDRTLRLWHVTACEEAALPPGAKPLFTSRL